MSAVLAEGWKSARSHLSLSMAAFDKLLKMIWRQITLHLQRTIAAHATQVSMTENAPIHSTVVMCEMIMNNFEQNVYETMAKTRNFDALLCKFVLCGTDY